MNHSQEFDKSCFPELNQLFYRGEHTGESIQERAYRGEHIRGEHNRDEHNRREHTGEIPSGTGRHIVSQQEQQCRASLPVHEGVLIEAGRHIGTGY